MGQYEFWVAIAAMAVITWLTRALPFLLMRKSQAFGRLTGGKFEILGPALLVSMTVVIIYSDLAAGVSYWQMLAYACGLLAAGVCVKRTANSGFAVLAGMAVYGALLLTLPS